MAWSDGPSGFPPRARAQLEGNAHLTSPEHDRPPSLPNIDLIDQTASPFLLARMVHKSKVQHLGHWTRSSNPSSPNKPNSDLASQPVESSLSAITLPASRERKTCACESPCSLRHPGDIPPPTISFLNAFLCQSRTRFGSHVFLPPACFFLGLEFLFGKSHATSFRSLQVEPQSKGLPFDYKDKPKGCALFPVSESAARCSLNTSSPGANS